MRILASAPGVAPIYEPMNYRYRRAGICAANWPGPYTFLAGPSLEYRRAFADMLSYRYRYGPGLKQIDSCRDCMRVSRDVAKTGWRRISRPRPLIKDPNALLSIEWIVKEFNAIPLILVRHPAAFANSIRKRGWEFPFASLLRQQSAIESLFPQYKDRIESFSRNPPSIERQAGLIWSILYAAVHKYMRDHPDWLVVRHEDVAMRPEQHIPEIFHYLGLEYTNRVRRKMHSLTTRPVRAARPESAVHWMRRDSKRVSVEWKGELDRRMLKDVREETDPCVFRVFYDERDWY